MRRLKIAMMSMTHGHTRKYYQVLKNNPKLEWIAVSTADKKAEDDFLSYVSDIPYYSSDVAMLNAHPEIEAVVLASENSIHLEQMKLCAERGIHILSMKIPTFNMQEYDEMIQLVSKNNVICQVELELHYNPVVRRMKELNENETMGKLQSLSATNVTLSPVWAFEWQGVAEKSYGKRVPLRENDNRFRGGALCDHPHIFDLIRHMTHSEFDTIFAQVAPNIREELEVEDMLVVAGKMKNGVVFCLDPSWSKAEEHLKVPGPGWEIFPKRMEVNLLLNGEKGTIMADCFGPNVYHNGYPNDRYTVNYTYFDEWIGLIDEFVECIFENKQPLINLKWHKNTINAMNCVYESIKTNKAIKL